MVFAPKCPVIEITAECADVPGSSLSSLRPQSTNSVVKRKRAFGGGQKKKARCVEERSIISILKQGGSVVRSEEQQALLETMQEGVYCV